MRPRAPHPFGPSLAVLLLATGCFTTRYLAQAAVGEGEMLASARPIRRVLQDPQVPPRIRGLLFWVHEIKAFGQAQGLVPTRNYERYADLHRPAAVWVVQACAPLAFEPKRWSFPIVGSVPYLGFFEPGAAQRYAHELEASEGLDVEVRTASAYSTLGWFHDPVLSTMIPAGDEAVGSLADTVLHESVHATVYVPNQSAFNESLASFVADRLTPVWLARTVGAQSAAAKAWAASEARWKGIVARLHQAYLALDELYRSPQSDEAKRAEKARQLAALQAELKLARPINNATLIGYKTYDTGGPAFERLLATCRGSWPHFLRAVATLRREDFDHPQQEDFGGVLERLAARGCGPTS
jgi:predicted aminopeptidase